jgi:hypothetical protein
LKINIDSDQKDTSVPSSPKETKKSQPQPKKTQKSKKKKTKKTKPKQEKDNKDEDQKEKLEEEILDKAIGKFHAFRVFKNGFLFWMGLMWLRGKWKINQRDAWVGKNWVQCAQYEGEVFWSWEGDENEA